MYYSRDVASWNYSVSDELSKEGCEILTALLNAKSESPLLEKQIKEDLSVDEATLILRKLMAKAKTKNWDPDILASALTIPEAITDIQPEYVKYVDEYIPMENVPSTIIPNLSHWSTAKELLAKLASSDKVQKRVRQSIKINMKGSV